MIAYIFVGIVCVGQVCEFMTSDAPVTYTSCDKLKQSFLGLKFKPEITLAATQCMKINIGQEI